MREKFLSLYLTLFWFSIQEVFSQVILTICVNKVASRFVAALLGRGSSSFLCNCLKQLEFLAIHLSIDDRNDDAFHKTLETPARVHRRGNLHMRLLLVFYRGHNSSLSIQIVTGPEFISSTSI